VILQTEAAECGLACLAMVLGYHGVITDLATLRARHAISLKGMSLATLSKLAQDERNWASGRCACSSMTWPTCARRPSCTGT
jgi:ABC-type bacteriocin/lantibiotic exporter with double-glycine peptidase domain